MSDLDFDLDLLDFFLLGDCDLDFLWDLALLLDRLLDLDLLDRDFLLLDPPLLDLLLDLDLRPFDPDLLLLDVDLLLLDDDLAFLLEVEGDFDLDLWKHFWKINDLFLYNETIEM